MGLANNMHQTDACFFGLEYVQCLYQGVSKVAIDFLGQSLQFFFNLPHVPIIFDQSTFRMSLIESNCLLHICTLAKSIVMYLNENAFLSWGCTAKFLLQFDQNLITTFTSECIWISLTFYFFNGV